MKRKKIYISGPMSASDPADFARNVGHFHDAALLLTASGHRPVNPARAWPCRFGWLYRLMERLMGAELAYRAVLCYDLWLLARCDHLCLIDGWHDSRGARIEEHFAYRLGILHTHDYQPAADRLVCLSQKKEKKR